MRAKIFLLLSFVAFGISSCSKDEPTSRDIDGTYNGFLYCYKTTSSAVVQVSVIGSTSTKMQIRGVSGTKIAFDAQKISEDGESIYYKIIPNDSIHGINSSGCNCNNTCNCHGNCHGNSNCSCNCNFYYSKVCECLRIKMLSKRDTLLFISN